MEMYQPKNYQVLHLGWGLLLQIRQEREKEHSRFTEDQLDEFSKIIIAADTMAPLQQIENQMRLVKMEVF